MRIIDLLNKANIEEIAEKLIENHNCYFNNKEKTINLLKRFFQDIHSIELDDVLSDDEYKDFTVIVNEYYDDNTLNKEDIFDIAERNRKTDYNFDSVIEKDLEKYFVVDGIHKNELKEKKDNIITDFKEYLEATKNNFEKYYITSYGLDFIARKTILACEVADLSIKRFGVLTCATEIFWELTFYGLTEEQVQKEASKLDERVKDIEDKGCEISDEEFSSMLEKIEIDQRDIDFATKFSRKVSEFNHRISYGFYKELSKFI